MEKYARLIIKRIKIINYVKWMIKFKIKIKNSIKILIYGILIK